uniref:Uncharacterized protein n=1 Tax=biofilter metagenome TaxID=1070537 RepID=A0A193SBN0_9ZZZZ
MKTVEEVRKERLAELRKEFGSFAAINEKLGRIPTDSTLSQIANASVGSKTKKPKTMGSEQARSLEAALDKPKGWMDTDPELLRAASAVVLSVPFSKVSVEDALDVVISSITSIPPTDRKVLAETISLLAEVPDSPDLRRRVLQALHQEATEAPSIENKMTG